MAHTAPKHQASSNHAGLQAWVEEVAELTQPDEIHWCDGSDEEYDQFAQTLLDAGAFQRLVGREAARTPTCACRTPPTWRGSRTGRSSAPRRSPTPARPTTGGTRRRCGRRSRSCSAGSMRGRTMYVVPFSMGPLGSPISYIGVQLTDSPYVAASMRIMTRMGQDALDVLGEDGDFVPCLHSVGRAAGRRAGRCRRGRVTRTTSTSSTSRRRARSGRSAPATAATRCSARSASRCGSPRRWRATRGGSPSTC